MKQREAECEQTQTQRASRERKEDRMRAKLQRQLLMYQPDDKQRQNMVTNMYFMYMIRLQSAKLIATFN